MTNSAELPLERLREGPPLANWLEALSHDSPFEARQDAAVGCHAEPPLAATVRGLLLLLRDPDPEARVRAVTALGDLGGQAHWALPVLRAALKEIALRDEEPVRTRAVRALLRAGPQPASEVAALVDSLHDELDVVRFHAAVALGDLGRSAWSAVAALTHAALWDEEPAVRVQAAAALWKIDRNKVPLVLEVLTRALAEDNELVCWVAADCLAQIGPEAREAIPALRQALARPFRIGLIRKGVALALRRVDPQAASEAGVSGPGAGPPRPGGGSGPPPGSLDPPGAVG